MSFFKKLFSAFSTEEKTEAQSGKNPFELPEDVSRQLEKELKQYFPLAIQKTLDLVTGIPDDVKKTLADRIASEYAIFNRAENEYMTEHLYPLIENFDWKWEEWEFWRPICVKRRQYTNGMRVWCFPWPDELDLDFERTEYEPVKVFNVMTLATAKERLSSFPETADMKKVELIDFLSKNEEAWKAVIDPHIKAKWDRKKHYEGPTPKMVFSLMLKTIEDRVRFLHNTSKIKEVGGTFTVKPFNIAYDSSLFEYAKRIKGNPWQEDFYPQIPGISYLIDPKFPKHK